MSKENNRHPMIKSPTREEVEELLNKARSEGRVPNLSGRHLLADYSGMDFTSNFRDRSGFCAQLLQTDFRHAKLMNCQFSGVDLAGANLRAADLSNTKFVKANLYNALFQSANLFGADLIEANLVSAELLDVNLSGANLAGARFGNTMIAGVDMSKAINLHEAVHVSPSAIGSDALRMTANGLSTMPDSSKFEILQFLSNAGLDEDFLPIFTALIGKPIEFYSLFISHSSLDKEFARKLYSDLRAIGVKCWFDEKQLLPGDNILYQIDRGIRLWDKLLLVCSSHSLSSRTGWWVEQELERALLKERELRKTHSSSASVLIPITIDDYVFDDWSSGYRSTILERYIGDFRDWSNTRKYAAEIERLLAAINAGRFSEE